VVVFEDLHWAEPTLLDLIQYLVEQATSAPILLLGLARLELLEQRPGWVEAEATRLAPLSGEASEALIDNLAEVPNELRERIISTAGGNPLFLEQLLAHSTEDGEPDAVPPSLEALLASRIDRLEPGELAVLQRAAVAGREFTRDAVVQLVGDEEARAGADSQLVALVRKGMVQEVALQPASEEAFRFHHVLIRDAAYATLPKTQRADLHNRLGGWLEAGPASPDELIGFHLEQAYRYRAELGPIDLEARRLASRAGARLATAGLRAAKTGDVHAASNLLTRAASLLEADEVARRDLLTELGLVLWRSGEVSEAEQTFQRAIETARSEADRRAELRARIELANFRIMGAREGGVDELLSLASDTISVFEQLEDERALGRIWYFLAFVHGGYRCHYSESVEAASRALGYFRRSGWPLTPCLQELAAGLYYGPTAVPDAIDRCRALLEDADRGGRANIFVFLAGLEGMAGRFESARELAWNARQIYEELAWTLNISANYAAAAADIELLAGDFVEARILLAESCHRLEDWGLRGQLATQATQLGEAVYGQGRYDQALHWSKVAESCTASYDTGAQFSWRALRGKALAREGIFGEAERLAREAVELAAVTDSVSQRAHVLLSHAEVLRLGGRIPEAAEAVEDAIQLLEAKKNVAALRRARSLLGELAGA
jgi:tetratricopeptide (TPR) repeat protein